MEELSGGGWKETPANGFAKHYDSDGLMEKIVNAAGDVWTFTHDANGLLTAATAPTGRITTYSYDASNKICTITDPADRVTTYTVDISGHLTEIVRPDNTNIEMLYDSAHRLSSMTRQCVKGRRFGDIKKSRKETSAWASAINLKQRGVDWQFKIDDARAKLKSLHPKIQV